MRVLHLCLLVVAGGLLLNSTAEAHKAAARHFVAPRSICSVHEGWPLSRPQRAVVVHPVRTEVHVATSRFAGSTAFSGTVTRADAAPTRDMITWEDGETLLKDEDWTEFTFNCAARGHKLWLEIPAGRPQFDWVEVVFDSGDAQVIDLAEKTCAPGLYALADFSGERAVDHVRVVGRSRTDEAKVTLRMQ